MSKILIDENDLKLLFQAKYTLDALENGGEDKILNDWNIEYPNRQFRNYNELIDYVIEENLKGEKILKCDKDIISKIEVYTEPSSDGSYSWCIKHSNKYADNWSLGVSSSASSMKEAWAQAYFAAAHLDDG